MLNVRCRVCLILFVCLMWWCRWGYGVRILVCFG